MGEDKGSYEEEVVRTNAFYVGSVGKSTVFKCQAPSRSLLVLPIMSLALIFACDPGVSYIVTRRAILSKNCPDISREFVMYRKLSCCPEWEPQIQRGRIIFGEKNDRLELHGIGTYEIEKSSDYISVFGGALGSGEDWASLQVICPSTGMTVYDSGEVYRADAFCKQGSGRWGGYLYMFEGHAQKKGAGSCCPEGAECPY